MTINIAVKCPEGIVLGSDSLNTILDDESGEIVSSIPYVSKLFSLGDSSATDKTFPVGVMINGSYTIGGIRVEDIIEEFQEVYSRDHSSDEFRVSTMGEALSNYVQGYVNKILGRGTKITLELIVAGFSNTKRINRKTSNGYKYGEIYSYFWEDSTKSKPRLISDTDGEWLTYYGGQPSALDRIRFGIDDWNIYSILKNRNFLYEQVQNYIYNQLKTKSKFAAEILKVKPPQNMSEFNIFQLFSSGHQEGTIGKTIKSIKENMDYRLQTMEGWFSLQTAVNYCVFLMSCAYAHSAFTFVIPVVGSEMRIATITRSEGFKFRRVWEIETPGPPFSFK